MHIYHSCERLDTLSCILSTLFYLIATSSFGAEIWVILFYQWANWVVTPCLDSITNSMDMNLGKLQGTVRYREAWHDAVRGVTKSWTWLGDWTTSLAWADFRILSDLKACSDTQNNMDESQKHHVEGKKWDTKEYDVYMMSTSSYIMSNKRQSWAMIIETRRIMAWNEGDTGKKNWL